MNIYPGSIQNTFIHVHWLQRRCFQIINKISDLIRSPVTSSNLPFCSLKENHSLILDIFCELFFFHFLQLFCKESMVKSVSFCCSCVSEIWVVQLRGFVTSVKCEWVSPQTFFLFSSVREMLVSKSVDFLCSWYVSRQVRKMFCFFVKCEW